MILEAWDWDNGTRSSKWNSTDALIPRGLAGHRHGNDRFTAGFHLVPSTDEADSRFEKIKEVVGFPVALVEMSTRKFGLSLKTSSQTNQRIKGNRAMLDWMISSRDLTPLVNPPPPPKMLHMLRSSWFLVAALARVVGSIQLYPVFCRLYPLGGLERDPVFPV